LHDAALGLLLSQEAAFGLVNEIGGEIVDCVVLLLKRRSDLLRGR